MLKQYNQLIWGCLGFFAFQYRDVIGLTLGLITTLTLIYVLLYRRNDAGYEMFGTVGGLVFIIAGAWGLLRL
jgi:hypothetical protein